jgi:transcriptional regulator with XRE-family HTH domain
MDFEQLFVLNLKKWRKNLGLSQKALAERCNAAHSYIRQLESGIGHPSFIFIGKLADALNIEPYQLFYDEAMDKSGPPSPPEPLESIELALLTSVNHEIKIAFDKLKKHTPTL